MEKCISKLSLGSKEMAKVNVGDLVAGCRPKASRGRPQQRREEMVRSSSSIYVPFDPPMPAPMNSDLGDNYFRTEPIDRMIRGLSSNNMLSAWDDDGLYASEPSLSKPLVRIGSVPNVHHNPLLESTTNLKVRENVMLKNTYILFVF